MRKFILFLFLLLVLCPVPHLGGAAPDPVKSAEAQSPDPSDLTGDWWSYFLTDPATFETRKDAFANKLNQIAASLPESSRSQAEAADEKILFNLRSIGILASKPQEPAPSAPPFRETYTLEDVISLNRYLQRMELDVKNDKNLQAEKEKTIRAYNTSYDNLLQNYTKAQPRSAEKVLLGMQLLESRSAIEYAKLELRQISTTLENDQNLLAKLKEELEYARNHLAGNQILLSKLSIELPTAEEAWRQSFKKLHEKESLASSFPAIKKTPLNAAEMALFQEELLESEIEAASYHADYIQAQIKVAITQYFQNPELVDLGALKGKFDQWLALMSQYQNKLDQWTGSTQRVIQRLSETLALPPQNDSESQRLRQLQDKTLKKAQANLLQLQRLDATFDDTDFLAKVLDDRILATLKNESWLSYFAMIIKGFFSNLSNWLSSPLFSIGATNITLLSIVKLLMILLLVGWLSRFITSTMTSLAAKRKGIQKSLIYRISRLVHYFLLSLGLIIALAAIGFDFSSFVLIAGALGVGLGFGLQSIFNNFISGLIILFESELNVGDFIELDTGVRGEIREIKVRNTIITTNDGTDILIPNSQLINNRVTNWTLSDPYRSVRVPFNVAFGTDKDLVVKIVKEVAKNASSTLNKIGTPEPKVFLTKLGDFGMEFTLVVWVNERATKRTLAAQSEYLWAIDNILKEYGIEIPTPHYDVRFTEFLGHTDLAALKSVWPSQDKSPPLH